MSNRYFLIFILISVLFFSCKTSTNRMDVDISDIKIKKIKIQRYGQALFTLDRNNLKEELKRLQPEFGIFLSGDLNDTLKIYDFISDTLLISVSKDCNKVYPNLNELEIELTKALKHYRYYYPKGIIPEIYTYISGFDYEYPVQYYDNNLLIALDMYLGENYPKYKNLGLPAYCIRKFRKEYIARDCMNEIARSKINYKKTGSTLLDLMMNEGKILWFIDAMMPDVADSLKIDYTGKQMKWAEDNEGYIWAFLIENELLYSTEKQKLQKFILDGPFTSYFGNESPPRLGWWIGWQIVREYMNNHTGILLNELMNEYDAQKILSKSGYKPGR
ncbi:MAG: hypothetical protein K8R37_06630 [Bacteroidales bacterium]|nr:hypothetical protein [Bacteroidales bacterium]